MMHCGLKTVLLVGAVWVIGLELPLIQEDGLLASQVLLLEIPAAAVPVVFGQWGVAEEGVVEYDDFIIVIEHDVLEVEFPVGPVHGLECLDDLLDDIGDLLFSEEEALVLSPHVLRLQVVEVVVVDEHHLVGVGAQLGLLDGDELEQVQQGTLADELLLLALFPEVVERSVVRELSSHVHVVVATGRLSVNIHFS